MCNLVPLHNFGTLKFLINIIGASIFKSSLCAEDEKVLMDLKNSKIQLRYQEHHLDKSGYQLMDKFVYGPETLKIFCYLYL